jgi:hypothetical protein
MLVVAVDVPPDSYWPPIGDTMSLSMSHKNLITPLACSNLVQRRREMVVFNKSNYVATHGVNPRGLGTWYFSDKHTGNIYHAFGTYTDAKKHIADRVKRETVKKYIYLEVMP